MRRRRRRRNPNTSEVGAAYVARVLGRIVGDCTKYVIHGPTVDMHTLAGIFRSNGKEALWWYNHEVKNGYRPRTSDLRLASLLEKIVKQCTDWLWLKLRLSDHDMAEHILNECRPVLRRLPRD